MSEHEAVTVGKSRAEQMAWVSVSLDGARVTFEFDPDQAVVVGSKLREYGLALGGVGDD